MVLIGGTGTGKTHLCVAIARACIRRGCRGRFFNALELVNLPEREHRDDRQGRLADAMRLRDFVILDELGYLPLARGGRAVSVPATGRRRPEGTARTSQPNPGASGNTPAGTMQPTTKHVHGWVNIG